MSFCALPWGVLISALATSACVARSTHAPTKEVAAPRAGAPRSECSGTCDTRHTCVRAQEDELCSCEAQPHVSCGGVETPYAQTKGWTCRPLHPLRDRGDGCPIAVPNSETACTGRHVCAYKTDVCGLTVEHWTCVNSQWNLSSTDFSPPPP